MLITMSFVQNPIKCVLVLIIVVHLHICWTKPILIDGFGDKESAGNVGWAVPVDMICIRLFLPATDYTPENVSLIEFRSQDDAEGFTVYLRHAGLELHTFDVMVLEYGSAEHLQRVTLSTNQNNVLEFVPPATSIRKGFVSKILLPICSVPSRAVCGEQIFCDNSDTSELRRIKRQVNTNTDQNIVSNSSQLPNVSTNSSGTNATSTSETTSSGGLSTGALVAAILVPILVVALACVGGYFLYRWLRSRRTEHGVYQPKAMESQSNLSKQPDPQSILKVPPEERLI